MQNSRPKANLLSGLILRDQSSSIVDVIMAIDHQSPAVSRHGGQLFSREFDQSVNYGFRDLGS
jgi:hypothetical protein